MNEYYMDFNESLELPIFERCSTKDRARKLALLSRKCSESGKFEDAARMLEEAIRAAPQEPDYRVLVASAYQDLVRANPSYDLDRVDRMLSRACDHLLDALRHDPDHAPSFCALGRIYREMGLPWRAREMWTYYIEMEPAGQYAAEVITAMQELDVEQEMRRLCEEASYLVNRGEPEKALPLLEQVTKERPDWYDAWFWSGLAYRELEMIDSGIRAFEKAVSLDTDSPYVLHELAALLARKGELEAAEGFWNKAIEIDSQDSWFLHNLGLLQWRQNRLQEAEATLLKAHSMYPANRKLWKQIKSLRSGEPAPPLEPV